MTAISTIYYKKYKKTEEAFAECMQKEGYKCTPSTREEDMSEHWDFLIEKDDVSLKVDVKAVKRISAKDEYANENIHWVEIKNVHGDDGWLYSDHNDGFMFELREYWLYVDKYKLRDLIKEKVIKEKVTDPYQAFYKLYLRRTGHKAAYKDITTLVRTFDLIYISDMMIKK